MTGRTTKSSLTMLAIAASLVSGGGALAADRQEGSRELAFTPGGVIELDFPDGGSARIEAWDEDDARVTWSNRYGDLDAFEVDVRETKGGIRIEAEWIGGDRRGHSFACDVRVPRRADVEFRSGGGGLTLIGLEGTFRGRTGGGSFDLRDVEGEVDLHSGGGGMEVIDCRLDGELSTGGGEVLLENVVGDLEATSGGGDVRYVNVRDHDDRIRGPGDHRVDGADAETVLIDSAGGGIDVREAPAGADVSTGGGSVTVRNASRFVSALTGGGDIEIEIADGWVDATTGAGDIDVEVTRGLGEDERGIDLTTGTGDVTLILPEGVSVELDVEVAYTRNSRRDYRIDSDIDLRTEHTDEWDFHRGSPRKYITGTATIGDGRHLVRIRTVNGDVRIRTRG
jgi:hypothetical protein